MRKAKSDDRRNIRDNPSPDSSDVVIIEFLVTGEDGDISELAFGDDESVKRISVMEWEVGGATYRFPAKGKDVESLLLE